MSKKDDSGLTPEVPPQASEDRLDAPREESQPEQSAWAERFSSTAFGNSTASGLSEIARQLSDAAAKSLPEVVFNMANPEKPSQSEQNSGTNGQRKKSGGSVTGNSGENETTRSNGGDSDPKIPHNRTERASLATPGEGLAVSEPRAGENQEKKPSELSSVAPEKAAAHAAAGEPVQTEKAAATPSTEKAPGNPSAHDAAPKDGSTADASNKAPMPGAESKPSSGESQVPPTNSGVHTEVPRAPEKDTTDSAPEAPLQKPFTDKPKPAQPTNGETHNNNESGTRSPAQTDNSNNGDVTNFALPKAVPLQKSIVNLVADAAPKDAVPHGLKLPTDAGFIKQIGSPKVDENGEPKKFEPKLGLPGGEHSEKDPIKQAGDLIALIGQQTAASGAPKEISKTLPPAKSPKDVVDNGAQPISVPHGVDSQGPKPIPKISDALGGQPSNPSPGQSLLADLSANLKQRPDSGVGSQLPEKGSSPEHSKPDLLSNFLPTPASEKNKPSGDEINVLPGVSKPGSQKDFPDSSNQGAKLGESIQNLLNNKPAEGKQTDNGDKNIPTEKQAPVISPVVSPEIKQQEIKTGDNKLEIKLPEIKEPSETKKKEEDKTPEHERLLQELFAQGVPTAPKHEEAEHNANPKVAPSFSTEKYEMASPDRDSKNPISQLINKIESVVENKIANIVQAVSERSHGSIIAVSSAQAPLSKSDLPLFQQPIMRINEIASELKRVSINDAAGASLADLSKKGGRFTAGEAMSLKDLIAANRQIDPSVVKGAISVDGKGLPLDGKGVISIDGKGGIDGKSPLDLTGTKIKFDPNGKVEELTPGKNAKVDPATGIKSGTSDDLSTRDDKRGSLKGSEAKVEDGDGKIRIQDDDDSLEGEDDDDDKKDLIEQNSDEDGDNLELILAGKIKKKDLDIEEESAAEEDGSNENETRKKYIVQEGDTLQSIAKSVLGDSRYDRLIEMVNRGQLKYHYKDGTRSVDLQAGQMIWLPTSRELKVFSSLYFTKGASSKVLSEKIKEEKTGAQSVEELIATLTQSIESVASYDTKTKQNDQTTAIDFAPLERKKKKTRPSFANSQSEAAHYSTGEWQEIEQFLNKLKNVAEEGIKPSSAVCFQSKDIELPLIAEDNLDIKILSVDTRIVVEYTMDLDEDEVFHARLQRQYDTEWKTVAYYQSSSTKAFRYLHKQSGGRKTFQLHLPNAIVREMALKDLSRNWRTYVSDFESNELPKVVRNVPIAH